MMHDIGVQTEGKNERTYAVTGLLRARLLAVMDRFASTTVELVAIAQTPCCFKGACVKSGDSEDYVCDDDGFV